MRIDENWLPMSVQTWHTIAMSAASGRRFRKSPERGSRSRVLYKVKSIMFMFPLTLPHSKSICISLYQSVSVCISLYQSVSVCISLYQSVSGLVASTSKICCSLSSTNPTTTNAPQVSGRSSPEQPGTAAFSLSSRMMK